MKVKGCCGRVSPCKRLCVQSCRCPLGEARRALLLKQRRPARSIARHTLKELNLKVKVMHPFASGCIEDATDYDLYTVDASDLMYWINDWQGAKSLFQSWPAYLAKCLDELRPHIVPPHAPLVGAPGHYSVNGDPVED